MANGFEIINVYRLPGREALQVWYGRCGKTAMSLQSMATSSGGQQTFNKLFTFVLGFWGLVLILTSTDEFIRECPHCNFDHPIFGQNVVIVKINKIMYVYLQQLIVKYLRVRICQCRLFCFIKYNYFFNYLLQLKCVHHCTTLGHYFSMFPSATVWYALLSSKLICIINNLTWRYNKRPNSEQQHSI